MVAGTSYTLFFDFYAIDTWDGSYSGTGDFFNVSVDTNQVFHYTFSNYNGDPPNNPQSYPGIPDTGRFNMGFGGYVDAIYRNVEIPFIASNAVVQISFQGQNLEDISNESWGIDNVTVRLTSQTPQTYISYTSLPADHSTNGLVLDGFGIRTLRNLLGSTATNCANYSFREAGANGVFGDADDRIIPLNLSFNGFKDVNFSFTNAPLQPGKYRFETKAGLLDANNNVVTVFTREFALANPSGGQIETPNNESIASATTLPMMESPSGSGFLTAFGLGLFSAKGEVDYWRFEAEAKDKLTFRLEASGNGIYPQLYLQDSAGQTLSSVGGDYYGIAQIQNYVVGKPGTYFVKVWSDNQTGKYELRVDQSRGPQLEQEGNNAQSSANALGLTFSTGSYQARIVGALTGNDAGGGDVFSLGTLNAGNAISVALASPTGSTLAANAAILTIEGAGAGDGVALTTNASGFLNFTVASNDVYYVRIGAANTNLNLLAQYLLNITVLDGVPPVVVSTSLPQGGGATTNVIDRVSVQFSEDLATSINDMGQRLLTYGGHRYAITPSAMTWEDAEAYAQSVGGHLVAINSSLENEWVRRQFSSYGTVWIGFTDKTLEGTWIWADGSPSAYTHWNPGEPNNSGGNENYAVMNTSGGWKDASATTTARGVVEIGTGGVDTDGDGLADAFDPFPKDKFNGLEMRCAGTDGLFGTADDRVYSLVPDAYAGGLTVVLRVSDGPLLPGKYQFTMTTSIKDRAGNSLASNYTNIFTVNALPGLVMYNGGADVTPITGIVASSPDGSLVNYSDCSTDRNPRGIAAGRLDGDTNLDLAVANYGSGDVSILVGAGDGIFNRTTNYATGNGAVAVVIGDLNKDNRMDLVVANNNAGNVTVLLGNADGTFQNATNYAVGSSPIGLVLGDFNKDGKLDVAVANRGASTISVLMGNGDGTLKPTVNYGAGNQPYSLIAADLNGDGKLDLAAANYSDSTVSVLLGNGDGTFSGKVDYVTGTGPRGLDAGDMNGDGKLDLVVADSDAGAVSILLGTGDGTFGAKADYTSGVSDVYQVLLADLNGDGRTDVIIPGYGSSRLCVLLNRGNGQVESPMLYITGNNPVWAVAGDYNGDQRQDLAVVNYNSYTVAIMNGVGTKLLAEDPNGSGVWSAAGRGQLKKQGDVEVWNFSGNAGDLVSVAVETPGNPSASQLYYRIYNSAGDTLTDFYTSYNGWGQSAPYRLAASGTYWIGVQHYYDFYGEYRLRVTLASPPTQMETEDNSDIGHANKPSLVLTNAHLTASVLGYIGTGDGNGDYYNLGNLSAGATIQLTMKQPSSSGLAGVLEIYDAGGNLVAGGAPGASPISYSIPPGGDSNYSARVTGAGIYGVHAASGNSALAFDGSADFVLVTNAPSLDFSNQFSLEAWVYPRNFAGRDRPVISKVGGTGGNNGYQMGFGQDGKLFLLFNATGESWPGNSVSTPPLDILNRWTHIAATYDNDTMRLYVNGQLAASNTIGAKSVVKSLSNLRIANDDNANVFFDGLVDDVRVWNTARSGAAILSGMSRSFTGTEAGLAGYWRFNEGSGGVATDLSPYKNSGILGNGVASQQPAWVALRSTDLPASGIFAQYLMGVDITDPVAPLITSISLPAANSTNQILIDRFTINFNKDMMASTVTNSLSYDLRSAGPDGVINTGDDVLYQVINQNYSSGLTSSYMIGDGPLQPGSYRLTAKTALKDRSGNALASDYKRDFVVAGVTGFITESRSNDTQSTATSLSITPGNLNDGSFSQGDSVGVGSRPYSIVSGRFNGDSHLDLATANSSDSTISILLGSGSGTFTNSTNIIVGGNPYNVVTGDFNGDGKPDLSVTKDNPYRAVILLGAGDGTFQNFTNYTVANSPRVQAVGDFNKDGKLDLAVACQSADKVSILLGNGDGTFKTNVDYPVGSQPFGIAMGDFNKDGKLDLVAADYNGDQVSVLMGKGDGTFEPAVNCATGGGPRAVAVGDMNGDDTLDVVTANSQGNSLSMLEGKGDGTFLAKRDFVMTIHDTYQILLTELNGDGRSDVVVAAYGAGRLGMLLNRGNWAFEAYEDYSMPGGIGVVAGDFNEDLRTDLAVASYSNNKVTVFSGNNSEWLAEDPAGSGIRSSAARGNISGANDVDYWSFTAKAGDILSLSVETPGNPGASQLYFTVYYPNGVVVSEFAADSYNGWGNMSPARLNISGTYTVGVRRYYDYVGEYRIRVTLAPEKYQMEVEPNNDIAHANATTLVLASGHQTANIVGSIGEGDGSGDYYNLGNLSGGTLIHLGLTQPTVSPLQGILSIYDASGKTITNSAIRGTNLDFTIPTGGDGAYYARIQSANPGALQFSGGNDYVNVGNWSPGTQWTIEAWVKPNAAPSGRHTIAGGFNSCADWGIVVQDGQFGLGTKPQDGSCSTVLLSGEAVLLNQWYHVAGTCDGTNALLYVNGALKGTVAVSRNYAANANGTWIGSEACCGNNTFSGLIQEVSIWERALSASEITSGLNHALAGTEAGLAGYWKLNEGLGSVALDSSTRNRNGTLVNGPLWMRSDLAGFASAALPSTVIFDRLYAIYALNIDLSDSQPPSIVSVSLPDEGSTNTTIVDRFTINFNKDMMAATVTSPLTYELRSSGPNGIFDTADDEIYTISCDGYTSGLTANYRVSDGPLQTGFYRFTIKTTLQDRTGNPLPQNYTRKFKVEGVDGFILETRNNNGIGQATSLSRARSANPDGSFGQTANVNVENNPRFAGVADLNGDGRLDMVVANSGSGNVSVLLGVGDGTFQPRTNYTTGSGPTGVALADYDKDGHLDAVVANYNANTITLLQGNGDGTFDALTNINTGNHPLYLISGDFNQDGKPDFAVTCNGENKLYVYIGRGDGSFEAPLIYSTGTNPEMVASGDFNGDGKPDLVVGNYRSANVSVLLGNGDGSFQPPVQFAAGAGPAAVAVGDLQKKGKLDLVVANYDAGTISVLRGDGAGNFGTNTDYSTGGNQPYILTLADINGDGFLDVVVPNSGSGNVAVMLNLGDGTFAAPVTYTTGYRPFQVVAKDFNQDGRMDFAAVCYGNAYVNMYLGNDTEYLAEDPVGSGIRTSASRGRLTTSSDVDYWSFTGKAGDWLSVAVDTPGNPSGSMLDFRVDGPNGVNVTDFAPSYYGYGQSSPVQLPVNGTYTILVKKYYDYQGEYRMRVTTAPSGYQLEQEDNSAISRANALNLALGNHHRTANVLGYIGTGDDSGDYFGLGNLGAGTTISLMTQRPLTSGLWPGMAIYKTGGTLVTNSVGGITNLKYTIPSGGDGAYYAAMSKSDYGPRAGLRLDGSQAVGYGSWFTNQTFSISMWIKPDASQTSYADIMDNNHRGGVNWVIQQDGGNVNSYSFGVADGGSPPTFYIAPGIWHHLMVSRDSSRLDRVYLDGQVVSSTTGTGDINYDNNQFLRTGRWGGGGRNWNGVIDELHIWDHALTASELQADMGYATTPNDAGIIGFWKFNEGAGSVVKDYSAAIHDGAIEGNSQWGSFAEKPYDPLFAQYMLNVDLSDTLPPAITAVSFPDEGITNSTIFDTFTVAFSKDMLASTVTDPGSYELRGAGDDGLLGTGDDIIYTLQCDGYISGLSAAYHILDGPLQPGMTRFTVATAMQDRSGNPIAAPFIRTFAIGSVGGFNLETRNNNTAATATPITLIEDPTGFKSGGGRGNLSSASDIDFWKFEGHTNESVVLSVEIPDHPGGSQLHYQVLGPNGKNLADFTSDYYGSGASSVFLLPTNGVYTIKVEHYYNYFYEYRIRLGVAVPPMQMESEGNDDIAHANPIILAPGGQGRYGSMAGNIRTSGDLDYYSLAGITNGSTVFLSVRLPSTSRLSPVVSLYDKDNHYLGEAPGGRPNDGVAQVRITQDGAYYAVVRGSEGVGGITEQYVLDVQVVPTGNVNFPNLQVTSVIPPTGLITSGGSIAFGFTVTNVGSVATAAAAWSDRAVLSQNIILGDEDDISLGVFPHVGALDPGAGYAVSRTAQIPDGISGPYYLIVQTDVGNAVNEFLFEADNTTVSDHTFNITLANYVDLKVEDLNVAGPDNAGKYTITWKTANRGNADAAQSFYERILIKNLTSGEVLLDQENLTTNALPVNSTLARTNSVKTSTAGNYLVRVTTDSRNNIFEYDATSHASAERNTVDASFQITQIYNIAAGVNPAGAGTIAGAGQYVIGSVAELTATPVTTDKPYTFLNWTENGTFQTASNTYRFSVTRDRQLTANFTLPVFQISAVSQPAVGGTVTGAGTYAYGVTNTLKAIANNGYRFTNWVENGSAISTQTSLTFGVFANRALTARFVEANVFHVVTTATLPARVAAVSGAGTYNNGQTASFVAPVAVTNGPIAYTFKRFTQNGSDFGTAASVTKTFSTLDSTNIAVVAEYEGRSILPVLVGVSVNYTNPVPMTTNYVLTFQFDRSMRSAPEPQVVLTNAQSLVQAVVPSGGQWSTTASNNDTYSTPPIVIATGMDGTNQVWISKAQDLTGLTLDRTNGYAAVVDATPPGQPVVSIVSSNATSVTLGWSGYAAPQDLAALRVYMRPTNYSTLAGLSPITGLAPSARSFQISNLSLDTDYFVAVVASDVAGNSASTVSPIKINLPTTLPPRVTIDVTAIGPNSARVSWAGYDTSALFGFSRFKLYMKESSFVNVTGMTPSATFDSATREAQVDTLDRSKKYYFAVVGVNATNGFIPIVTTRQWSDPYAGNISANLTIGGIDQTVDIYQTMIVTNGATLTIKAGSTLRFAKGAGINVEQGLIMAEGTALDPIVLTSSSDVSGGGAAAGDWSGLLIKGSAASASKLTQVWVKYGQGLVLDNASPAVDAFSAVYNFPCGLRLTNGAVLTTKDALINLNQVGAMQSDTSRLTLLNSVIKNNVTNAWARGSLALVATQNWWGTPLQSEVASRLAGNVDSSAFLEYEPLLTPAAGVVGGLSKVSSQSLELRFACRTAESMRASENSAFVGEFFAPFAPGRIFQLSDGAGHKNIFVQYRSTTGETNAPILLQVDYVTSGPQIINFNLAEGQIISRPLLVTGLATAVLGIQSVEFYADNVLANSVSAGVYSRTWDMRTLSPGIHRVKLLARDKGGSIATEERNVTINPTPAPAPSIVTPASDGIQAQATVTIAGTAEPNIGLRLTDNGTLLATATADATGGFKFENMSLMEGANEFVVIAYDDIGSSRSITRRIVLDTGAPSAVVLDAPIYVPNFGVNLSWNYAKVGERPSKFQVFWAKTPFISTNQAIGKSLLLNLSTYAVQGLADGTYYFGVLGYDDAGNRSPLSGLVSLKYDATAPTFTISYDKTPPVGLGPVQITLTASEPLSGTPGLTLKPANSTPVSLNLTNVSASAFVTAIVISNTTPSGLGIWNASGQDVSGNTFNGAPAGQPFIIDVIQPTGIIVVQPASPVQTLVPTNASVNLTLSKPAKTGTPPIVKFTPPTGDEVGITMSGTGSNWVGLLPLQSSMGSGFGQFAMTAVDPLDNTGTNITSGSTLEIYNTALPSAPETPTNIVAQTVVGGVVRMSWNSVTNADIYRLYREAGSNATAPTTLVADNISTNRWDDVPPADGRYTYAVTASRRGSESNPSKIVVGLSDRTPPGAPLNVAAELASSGVRVSWQPPIGEKPYKYLVYRNGQLIGSTSTTTNLVDAPPRGVAAYTVSSADVTGNENLSAPASIEMLVGAVEHLAVLVNSGQAPVLSWTSSDTTAISFNVYRKGIRQNSGTLAVTSYTDNLPAGADAIEYAVRAVNAKGEESAPRIVKVYSVTLDLLANAAGGTASNPLVTRYFDSYRASVTNLTLSSGFPLETVELRRLAGGGVITTQTIPVGQTVAAGNWYNRDVVFASATAVDAQSMRMRVIQTGDLGGSSVTYQRTFDFASVLEPSLMMSLSAGQPPLAGGLTDFDVKLYNRGYADINVIVARENGAAPGDIYVAVKNALGQEVSRTAYRGTPKGTFFMNDGRGYVRVAPGASINFTVSAVLVPEALALSASTTFEAAASRIYYRLGTPDVLESGPISGSMSSTLRQTDYFGTASTDRTGYSNDDPIVISGKAIVRSTGLPLANAPLKIGFATRGFNWFKETTTDSQGNYQYSYSTMPGFGGSLMLWAAHPDVFDQLNQVQVSVYKMYATPSRGEIRMSKNDTMDFSVSLVNPGDIPLTGFTTEFHAYVVDGTNYNEITTITGTNLLGADFQVEQGKNQTAAFRLKATPNAPDKAVIQFDVRSEQGALATFVGNVTLLPALPVLNVVNPAVGYLEVSLDRGKILSRQVTVVNGGLKDLQGIELIPPTNVTWMSVNLPVSADGRIHLPDIGIGQSNTFSVVFTPPADTPLDYYNDFIAIRGTNAQTEFKVRLYALVTSDQKGSVQFFVDNNLGQSVSNATVRLRSSLLQLELTPSITDSNGLVTVDGLQEGDWSWQVNAPGHNSTVGTITVVPSQTVQVHTRLAKSLVTVTFNVVPVPYTDKYEIKIEQTFETHVPVGVLVVDPPFKDFKKIDSGFEANWIVTVKNYGLLEMTDLTIKGAEMSGGVLTPLIEYVPVLLPMQTIEVPFTFTYNYAAVTTTQSLKKLRTPDSDDLAQCVAGMMPFGSLADPNIFRGLAAIFQARERCVSDLDPQTALASVGIIFAIGQIAGAIGSAQEFVIGAIGGLISCIIGNFLPIPDSGPFSSYPGPRSDNAFQIGNLQCFDADTPVLMSDGSSRPIASVKVGDRVKTGSNAGNTAQVRAVFARDRTPVRKLTLSDGLEHGVDREIITTDDHLFWVDGRGWIAASNLKAGDLLVDPNNARIKVLANHKLEKAIRVYSFQLSGDSAFYANGVLVRDMCGLGGALQVAAGKGAAR
jgi:fibronectin type 3 domain-containing protein